MTESTTVTITNPDFLDEKKVDTSGRAYIGTEYEGDHIRIVVKRVKVDESEDESEN